MACRAAKENVPVLFEEYEAMPHCFAMLLPSLATADRCMRSCGDFCRRCVEEPASVATKATYIYAKTGEEKSMPAEEISTIGVEDARRMMRESKERRTTAYEAPNSATPKSTL